jgi:tetratricopeptide (TPR) repeat protein
LSLGEKESTETRPPPTRADADKKDEHKAHSSAIKKYEAIVQSGNADVTTWIKLGEAYNAAGDFEKAIKCYDKATVESYEEKYAVPILTGLAEVYPKIGDFEKEAETYTKLLKKVPKEPFIWKKAARAYERVGKIQEAKLYYSGALNLSPRDPNLLYHYSFFCEKMDQMDNAITTLEKALELRPESTKAMDRLIILYSRAKQQENVLKYTERVLKVEPGNPDRYEDLALAYRAAKRDKDAARVCHQGIMKFKSAPLWEILGDILAEQGKDSNALFSYENAAVLGSADANQKAGDLREKRVTPKAFPIQESGP